MNQYTCEQLQTAVGDSFKLLPCAGTHKARVQRGRERDTATIDFEHGRIEARLTVTWDEKDLAAMSDRQPDANALAYAKQELVEEVLYDWELAGFTIPTDGALEWLPCPDQIDRKSPVYVVVVTRSAPTLAGAVEALRATTSFCCHTTIKVSLI